MKKNGFIATSLLYAFFLVFISLFIVLLLNYLHNRLLIQKIDDNAKVVLSGINNTKLTDLKVGDYVVWKNLQDTRPDNPLSEKGKWQVAKKNGNTFVLLSDLAAASPSVKVLLDNDLGSIPKKHPMGIQVFYEMNNPTKRNTSYGNKVSYYNSSLKYKNYPANGLRVEIVKASTLASIRNDITMDEYTKRELFDMNGSYVINMDVPSYSSAGYKTSFPYQTVVTGVYYLYKAYTFDNYRKTGDTSLLSKKALLESYCGASFDTNTNSVNYSYTSGGTVRSNPFGYVDITDDSAKDDEGHILHTKYLDFCYFASPVAYNHRTNDLIVIENEQVDGNGDLLQTTTSSVYRLRFEMTLNLNGANQNQLYIAGGKGIANDPYIIDNGVQQS